MPTSTLALAFSLSVDSFAVALGRGAAVRHATTGSVLSVGVAFALCQTLTPLAGWAVGIAFAETFRSIDHWITFVLMTAVGLYLIANVEMPEENGSGIDRFRFFGLFAGAMASSLDAATVGLSLGVIRQNILETVIAIGAVTFVMSCLGVAIGRSIGPYLGRWAGVSGGTLLIALGIEVLYEHA